MAKYLPLPDGSSLKVPDSMSLDEASAKALIKFPNLFYVSDAVKCGFEIAYTPMLLKNNTYACGLNARMEYDSRFPAEQFKTMPQYLPLPDGRSLTVREGESAAQAWARAQQMYPEAFGNVPEKQPGPGPKTGLMADVMGAKNTNKENVSKGQTIHLNETSITNALFPSFMGVAVGFLVAYLIYFFTIKKWYATANGRKLEYWCGVIALIAIANGLAGISHELLFNLLNDSQIKSENIYKGVFAVLFFPIIMLLFAFFLRKIFKIKASSTEITIKNEAHYSAALQEIKENRQREGLWAIAIANNHGDNNKATAEYINTRVAEMSGKPNDDRTPEESKNKNLS